MEISAQVLYKRFSLKVRQNEVRQILCVVALVDMQIKFHGGKYLILSCQPAK